jgi:hypothetical protein
MPKVTAWKRLAAVIDNDGSGCALIHSSLYG